MDAKYWLGRWERGETGWHQQEVEPALIEGFSTLEPRGRVLVPLCGKSLDLDWLVDRGFDVVGAELSASACEAVFARRKITPERSTDGELSVLRGGGLTLYNGDFFKLEPRHVKGLVGVYDRAALIALPPELRPRYAAHLASLVRAGGGPSGVRFLQIVLERVPHDLEGPPFSVQRAELERLYSAHFHIKDVSRGEVDMGKPATSRTDECVYELEPC